MHFSPLPEHPAGTWLLAAREESSGKKSSGDLSFGSWTAVQGQTVCPLDRNLLLKLLDDPAVRLEVFDSAPLYALAKALIRQGKHPTAILGFNTAEDVFCQADFEALGIPVFIATADGSAGVKGFVTDAMAGLHYDYFYACGPMPMFRAIERAVQTSGQYSFEERMGCGFGACMGCSCRTKNGNKRICKDGPVLMREEVIW